MNASNQQEIGNIGNYYGGLSVKTEDGKCYWSIENYTGYRWEEIPDSLYRALVEYETARQSLIKVSQRSL
jgi:hypothetical protein